MPQTTSERPRLASPGIHHVTAIAGDAQENVAFYAGLLGLRLVKRTVNFDDPGTYHLYFGDEAGRPGTLMTFFPWGGAPRGRVGPGQVTHTAFAVPPGSLDYWRRRIEADGRAVEGPWARLDERGLGLADADGLGIELIESAAAGASEAWRGGPVPAEHAIRSFHGVTLTLADHARTAEFLTGAFGFVARGGEGDRLSFAAASAGAASRVDLVASPGAPRGRMGVGVVHHVAWRAPGDHDQNAIREEAERRGLHPTPVVDRKYFRSVYFREPGGVLFEVATDAPGMAIDEAPESLGTRLVLPPWLESIRPRIEEALPPLAVPSAETAR